MRKEAQHSVHKWFSNQKEQKHFAHAAIGILFIVHFEEGEHIDNVENRYTKIPELTDDIACNPKKLY